jgi:hypothetical protein
VPEAAKPVAMLGLIERLDHVRAAGLDPARAHRVHQTRLAQLAREAGRTERTCAAGGGAEEGRLLFGPDARRTDIGVEVGLQP